MDSKQLDLVLLIDDDEVVNTLNKIILRQTGLVKDIQAVKSGSKGLQELANYQKEDRWPALIFVDINMPGIGGWEFIKLMSEQFKGFKGKSIINMLSSSLDPRDKEKASKSTLVDGIISKPLSHEVVIDLYKKYRDL